MHVVTIVVLHEVTLVLRLWSWYVLALALAIIDLTLVSRALYSRKVRKLNLKQECDRDR